MPGSNRAAIERSAMAMLALREHSRFELEVKLKRKGFDAVLIEQVLARLVDLDLQSDQRFVESFVRSRTVKGQGPCKIRGELRQRRVAESLIEHELSRDADYWLDRAEEARRKRFGPLLPGCDLWQQQARFLSQRGFPADLIYRLLDSLESHH